MADVEEETQLEVTGEEDMANGDITGDAVEENAVEGNAVPAPDLKKVRVKRLPEPDPQELNRASSAINEAIAECQKKLAEIKESLDGRDANKQQFQDASKAQITKLQEIQAVTRALVEERNQLRTALNEAKTVRDPAARPPPKSKPAFNSVEEINNAIRELEFRQATSTLSLKEEKQIVADIRNLNLQREAFKEYSDRSTVASKSNEDKAAIYEKLKVKDAEINRSRDLESEQRQVLDSIRAEQQTASAIVPTLLAERKVLREHIADLHKRARELREDYQKRRQEWVQNERLFRSQLREDREKQRTVRAEEYKQRQAAREAKVAEYRRHNPYEDDLALMDVLGGYLSSFLKKDAAEDGVARPAAAAPAPAASGSSSTGGQPGFFRRRGDDDDDVDVLFKGKGGKKNKKGAKPAAAPAPKNEKITHTLDKFLAFEKFKLTPPLVVSEVQATLDDLAERKETLKKKEAVWKAKMESGEAFVPDEDESVTKSAPEATKTKAKNGSAAVPTKEDFPSLGAPKTVAAPDTTETAEPPAEEAAEEASAPPAATEPTTPTAPHSFLQSLRAESASSEADADQDLSEDAAFDPATIVEVAAPKAEDEAKPADEEATPDEDDKAEEVVEETTTTTVTAAVAEEEASDDDVTVDKADDAAEVAEEEDKKEDDEKAEVAEDAAPAADDEGAAVTEAVTETVAESDAVEAAEPVGETEAPAEVQA